MLVVDAQAHARWSAMRALIRDGAHVDGVANGREAFMLCRRRPFDVVIIDLGLPDTAGDVLVRAIRAVSSPTCLVVVTGTSEPLGAKARQAGADRIFSSPTDWGSILTYLRSRELTRAA